jgi:hypothetical protein
LLRAIGPTLAGFGVSGALEDPQLILLSGAAVVERNDNWQSQAAPARIVAVGAQVGAFPLPAATADAALLSTVATGAYTAHVIAPAGAGTALVEVYDGGGAPGARLANLSARTLLRADGAIIAGFVVEGNPRTLLIRAAGPALAEFGLPDALPDPTLQLFQGASLLAENNDWGAGGGMDIWRRIEAAVGAFALPASGRDAALLVTLPPGSYTAKVNGTSRTGGSVLVEIYEVP